MKKGAAASQRQRQREARIKREDDDVQKMMSSRDRRPDRWAAAHDKNDGLACILMMSCP